MTLIVLHFCATKGAEDDSLWQFLSAFSAIHSFPSQGLPSDNKSIVINYGFKTTALTDQSHLLMGDRQEDHPAPFQYF